MICGSALCIVIQHARAWTIGKYFDVVAVSPSPTLFVLAGARQS